MTVKVNLNEYKPNLKLHIIISLHGKEIHSSLIPLTKKEQAFNIVFDSIEYWNVSSPILYDVKLALISNNKEVDNVLKLRHYDILEGKGKISKKDADKKAEKEYEKYKVIQDKEFLSDFDLLMLKTEKINKIGENNETKN